MVNNHVKVRGKQRLAVLRSLMYPGSGSFLFERAKIWANRIAYHDLRKITRDFELSGLVESINPTAQIGRIYRLTHEGVEVYRSLFPENPTRQMIYTHNVDALAVVIRRFLIKKILFTLTAPDDKPLWLTVTDIKKRLRHTHSTSLTLVAASMRQLEQEGYVESDEFEVKNHLERRYRLTTLGEDVRMEIIRMKRPPNLSEEELFS